MRSKFIREAQVLGWEGVRFAVSGDAETVCLMGDDVYPLEFGTHTLKPVRIRFSRD